MHKISRTGRVANEEVLNRIKSVRSRRDDKTIDDASLLKTIIEWRIGRRRLRAAEYNGPKYE